MGILADMIFGKVDPHPIFNGMNTSDRRSHIKCEAHIKEMIRTLNYKSKTTSGTDKFINNLLILTYETYSSSFSKSVSSLNISVTNKLADSFQHGYDFHSQEWKDILNSIKTHPVLSEIITNICDASFEDQVKECQRVRDAAFQKQRERSEALAEAQRLAEDEIENGPEIKELERKIIEAYDDLNRAADRKSFIMLKLNL